MNMPISSSNAVNLALFILRVMLGLMILSHGLNKFFGGGKIAGTAAWFESIGVRPGKINALMAATTEVGTGILLVIGFLTPLACAGLCSLMIVAIVTVHRKNGFFIFNPGGGIEYCLVLAVTAIALGGLGAGAWSLDHTTKIWNVTAATGLWIAAAVGIGGALLQLLGTYRPGKVAKAE
jgi:putative oxidoreductase